MSDKKRGWGGKREGAGRPPKPNAKVKRSVSILPSVDQWVQAQQLPDESYSATVERLLSQLMQPHD